MSPPVPLPPLIEVTQPANQPPEISDLSDSPDPVDRGDNVTLTATGVSDPDGSVDRVEFYYDANNNGVFDEDAGDRVATDNSVVGETASATFGTGAIPAGTRRFFAVAFDDQGARSAAEATRCSIIQKWNLAYQVTPVAGGTISENPVAGRYPEGTQVNPSAQAAANYRFDHWEVNGTTKTMPVTLAADTTVMAVFEYNGTTVVPPRLNAIGNQSVNMGTPFSLTVTKQQGDTPITWTLENKPTGMTIDRNGVVSWPNPTPGGSSHYITVKAENSAGNDTESFTLYVLAPADNTDPTVQITGPTAAATCTSPTNVLPVSGTATDNVGVVQVKLVNNRAIGEYLCSGTTAWSVQGIPLYSGVNHLSVTARDAEGNDGTDTLAVTYNGDSDYEDVLRSGGIVQEIVFPDNLTPGDTVTVQWKILSYVPVRCRLYARDPAKTWICFRNGEYVGYQESQFNLYGRHAGIYSFQCNWPVPQKSGEIDVWFNVAQMDGDQYMMPMIPDGVDSRPHPTVSKVIQRTILPGGDGTAPQSDTDIWFSDQIFETVDQHKMRSACTVTSITCPDNVSSGAQMTCEWKVLSYVPVDSQVLLVNISPAQIYVTAVGTLIDTADTTYRFTDRSTSQSYYAKEYTYRATFNAAAPAGSRGLCFRNRKRGDSSSSWMFGNISNGADSENRPAMCNDIYGRFIERTINP